MAALIRWVRSLIGHLLPPGSSSPIPATGGREQVPEKLPDFCQMIKETEVIADKDLDRLILTCELMNWVTGKVRRGSKRSKLVDLMPCS